MQHQANDGLRDRLTSLQSCEASLCTPSPTNSSDPDSAWQRVPGAVDLTPGHTDPSFDVLVLGCGGGPLETNLSSWLVKAAHESWTHGAAALEGGSTIGAIASLIERCPRSFEDFDLGIAPGGKESQAPGTSATVKRAGAVWEMIQSFAISHAHLDHIAGLVISSAACSARKNVFGLPSTISNLEKVMDFGVWPNLGTRDPTSLARGKAYVWRELDSGRDLAAPCETRHALSTSLTLTAQPISHGSDPSYSHEGAPHAYVSTAFFVRNEETQREFLFLGDVEPDSVSSCPRTREVWQVAAEKIVDSHLDVVFLECSYPSSQPVDLLFGHLSPPFVLEELQVLADYVQEERARRNYVRLSKPLEGLHVVIQHIKDDIFPPGDPPVTTSPCIRSRPERVKLATNKVADFAETPLALPLLSMSPSAASVPLRRPSGQHSPISIPAKDSSPSSSITVLNRNPSERDMCSEAFKQGTLPKPAGPGTRLTEAPGGRVEVDVGDGVEETVHERIRRELFELEEKAGTGARFLIAQQGMRLAF